MAEFFHRRLHRWVLTALLISVAAGAGASIAADKEKPHIVVLVSYDAPPYRDALKGFQQALAQRGIDAVVDVHGLAGDAQNAARVLKEAKRDDVRLVLTLGMVATRAALTENPGLPVVAGLILNADVLEMGSNATGVVLELPVQLQFEWMQRVLPPSTRIGVLYNPAENEQRVSDAQRIAHEDGFELIPFRVSGPQALPSALDRAVNRMDALWAIPDSLVVSPETAKTLLLFSFRNRVPMIGLSSAWVKAGALFALDWDYEDTGMQCAELAAKVLMGARPGGITPVAARRITYAVNLKTAREMRVGLSESLIKGASQVFE